MNLAFLHTDKASRSAETQATGTWEEFSSYMLEAGNVSEVNNNKQTGSSMLANPSLTSSSTCHANTVAQVAYHPDAPRFVTISTEAPAGARAVKRGGGGGRRGG